MRDTEKKTRRNERKCEDRAEGGSDQWGNRLRCSDTPRITVSAAHFGDKNADRALIRIRRNGRGRSWGTKRAWKEAKGRCLGYRRGWHLTGRAALSGSPMGLRSTWVNSARSRGGSSPRRCQGRKAGNPEAQQLHEGRASFYQLILFDALRKKKKKNLTVTRWWDMRAEGVDVLWLCATSGGREHVHAHLKSSQPHQETIPFSEPRAMDHHQHLAWLRNTAVIPIKCMLPPISAEARFIDRLQLWSLFVFSPHWYKSFISNNSSKKRWICKISCKKWARIGQLFVSVSAVTHWVRDTPPVFVRNFRNACWVRKISRAHCVFFPLLSFHHHNDALWKHIHYLYHPCIRSLILINHRNPSELIINRLQCEGSASSWRW